MTAERLKARPGHGATGGGTTLRLLLGLIILAPVASAAAPGVVVAAGLALHTISSGGDDCAATGAFTVEIVLQNGLGAISGASDCLFAPDSFADCAEDTSGTVRCSRNGGATASLRLAADGSLLYRYTAGGVVEEVAGRLTRAGP